MNPAEYPALAILVGRIHHDAVLLLEAIYEVHPELRPWDYLETKGVWNKVFGM